MVRWKSSSVGMMKRATVMKTECFRLCRWKTLIYNKTCFEIVFGRKILVRTAGQVPVADCRLRLLYHGIITWIKLYSQFRQFPVIISGIISGKLR